MCVGRLSNVIGSKKCGTAYLRGKEIDGFSDSRVGRLVDRVVAVKGEASEDCRNVKPSHRLTNSRMLVICVHHFLLSNKLSSAGPSSPVQRSLVCVWAVSVRAC